MKKSYFIILLLMILLISFAHSVDIYTGLTNYYSYDIDEDDELGSIDGDVNGADKVSGCKLNGCYKFIKANSDNIDYGDNVFDNSDTPISFSFWFNRTADAGDYEYIVTVEDNYNMLIWNNDLTTINVGFSVQGTHTPTLNTWYHYVATIDRAGNTTLWVNGVKINTVGGSYNSLETGTSGFLVGESNSNIRQFTGYVDELAIYNGVTLSEAQILALYYNGTGCNPLTNHDGCEVIPPAPAPTLTINTNLVNGTSIDYYTNNKTFSFNGTVTDSTEELFNCTLFNYTNSLVAGEYNLTINNNIQFNFSETTEAYNFSIFCNNDNDNFNATSSGYVYLVDRVLPSLVINSDFVNNSEILDNLNLNIKINCTDENLFAVEVNMTELVDGLVFNYFADNIAITTQEVNITNSTQLLGTGNYTILASCWDSHTDETVRPLQFYYSDDKIIINDYMEIWGDLKYYNNKGALVTYFYLSDDKTKYKMKVTFNEDSLEHNFYIHSNSHLAYLPTSKYKGHFVLFDHKLWIDFESENIESLETSYIGDGVYEITVHHYQSTDEIELESIGDLNENSLTWYFSIIDGPSLTDLYILSLNETAAQGFDEITGGINMIAISVLIVGSMFFWIFLSTRINATDDNKQIIKSNMMLKMILFALAGFTSFIAIQLAYGVSQSEGFVGMIDSNLQAAYTVTIWIVIIILFLLLFAGIINLGWGLVQWLGEQLSGKNNPKRQER